MPQRRLGRWSIGFVVIVVGATYFLHSGTWQQSRPASAVLAAGPLERSPQASLTKDSERVLHVQVVRPAAGGIDRTTTQPGTIEAFDYADLYAKVSGYLDRQDVDIGDAVKKGQVLAEISAPELREELHHAEAAQAQAEAQVQQMQARVVTAEADFQAAAATIKRSEADEEHASATLSFRRKQYERIKNLFSLKSVDERLVDEKEEQYDAARAAERAAEAAVLTAQAQAGAAQARVASAQADLVDARAKVQVARSAVARARVFVNYLRFISPYDGVVTKRNFHVGDFIRAADQGGHLPLLTVARTDLMRVVIQVPERDVPFTNKDDPALVELDALAGKKFHARVSRVANSEDRVTKSMRTEVDLTNTDNELRDGMFGRVTIHLHKASQGLTVPSTSLIGDSEKRSFSVFIVRSGHAQRVPVEVGHDDGVRIEIISGLQPDDQVVLRPGDELSDGTKVEAEETAGSRLRRKL